MSTKAKVVALVAVLAAVICVATLRTGQAQMVPGMPQMPAYVLEGNFRVQYILAFTDNTTDKGTEEQVKKIEFHPEKVVITKQTGDGRVIPVHAIKHLTWQRS